MSDLYADGGVIEKNPSPHGGTFCWVLVESGQVKTSGCGIIRPSEYDIDKISNNVSELVATLEALQFMQDRDKDWAGTIWTDSKVTLTRLLGGQSFKGVPSTLRQWCLDLRRGRKWGASLLSGHPSRKALEIGFNDKGTPVSQWNVYCDKECQRLARQYLESKDIKRRKK